MKVLSFILVVVFSLKLVAMEPTMPSTKEAWIEFGKPMDLNNELAFERQTTSSVYGAIDGISEVIKHAQDGMASVEKLNHLSNNLEGTLVQKADYLAQKFDRSGYIFMRIPNNQVNDIWDRVTTAYKGKKLGDGIKLSPADDQKQHRLYVYVPDCYNDITKMKKIIAVLKTLGLNPTEYQPAVFFELGIRLTKQISELDSKVK